MPIGHAAPRRWHSRHLKSMSIGSFVVTRTTNIRFAEAFILKELQDHFIASEDDEHAMYYRCVSRLLSRESYCAAIRHLLGIEHDEPDGLAGRASVGVGSQTWLAGDHQRRSTAAPAECGV